MAYASYEEYRDFYRGGDLTREQFEVYAQRAGDYLELLTYGRCGGELSGLVRQAVVKSCCAVADELYRQVSQPELRSHAVGGWSRTYAPEKNRERRLADAARLYLRGTGLLWRGFVRKAESL